MIVRVKKSQFETEWLRVTPHGIITPQLTVELFPFFAALSTPWKVVFWNTPKAQQKTPSEKEEKPKVAFRGEIITQ